MSDLGYVQNTWYVAGFSAEFPKGKLIGQRVTDKPIVMWRDESGKVVAFDDRCPHKRMPLSAGRLLDNGTVECAYHGFCFNGSGKCVSIPALPEGGIPPKAVLKPFPVVEQDGVVWIWPGDPDKSRGSTPPRTPEFGDGNWYTVTSDEPIFVKSNAQLLIENILDISHFYPLHDGNIGDISHSRIPVEVVEDSVDGQRRVMTIRKASNYHNPPYWHDWFGEVVDRVHTHQMLSPAALRVQLRCAAPGQLGSAQESGFVLYHLCTPADGDTHNWRWSISTKAGQHANDAAKTPLADKIAEGFLVVAGQDKWALELQQQSFAYPDDGYEEVLIRSDRAMMIARRILQDMQAAEKASEAGTPARQSTPA